MEILNNQVRSALFSLLLKSFLKYHMLMMLSTKKLRRYTYQIMNKESKTHPKLQTQTVWKNIQSIFPSDSFEL
jgi:hypothetical protein